MAAYTNQDNFPVNNEGELEVTAARVSYFSYQIVYRANIISSGLTGEQ
jgi:hypothetical protein